jgi:mevalonate pyrophosphate decarboxylase
VIICNYCGKYFTNYNPSINSFVCPSCTRTWYTIIPLSRYRKLKEQADFKRQQKIQQQQDIAQIIQQETHQAQQQDIQKVQEEPSETFKSWVKEWEKNYKIKEKAEDRIQDSKILKEVKFTKLSRE